MGCLDPKVDPGRTFDLLRKRGAIKAVLGFSGGHDEGWVHSITLTLSTGEEVDLEVWYCGGYGYDAEAAKNAAPGDYRAGWVPLSKPENEDQELSDLLQGPIDENFGSWGDIPSTEGMLVWDVFTGKASLSYEQQSSQYTSYEETYS